MQDLIRKEVNIFWYKTLYVSSNIEVLGATQILRQRYVGAKLPSSGIIYINQSVKTCKCGPGDHNYNVVYTGNYFIVKEHSKDLVYIVPQDD